jgi:cytochrome c biogenesis protein CcmG/thiol:disulfide interchange protein DsbE
MRDGFYARWPHHYAFRPVKRYSLPAAVAVTAAALIGLLAYGLASKADNRTLDDAVAHGQRPLAPGGTLANLDGSGRTSLAAYRGRVVVLNFWASWCDPCKAEAPMLQSAQATLLAHGGTVLGVTDLDAAPDSRAFVAQNRLTYPEARDPDGSFVQRYGTVQLPETFVIDRQGKVAAIRRGQVTQRFIDRAVALAEAS